MARPAPEVLRKGALVRVAGDAGDEGADVLALAFLDLRYVERDVAQDFREFAPRSVDDLPCSEVVVEWGADPTWTDLS